MYFSNLQATRGGQGQAVGVVEGWPNRCAAIPGTFNGNTITCPNSVTSGGVPVVYTPDNIGFSGGGLWGVGFFAPATGDWSKIVIGSGVQVQGSPMRGSALPAPWNDQAAAVLAVTAPNGVTTPVVLGMGIRQLTVRVPSPPTSVGTITVTLPPNPNLGDPFCASATKQVSATWSSPAGAPIGFPTTIGVTPNFGFCARWTGVNWNAS